MRQLNFVPPIIVPLEMGDVNLLMSVLIFQVMKLALVDFIQILLTKLFTADGTVSK